MKVKRKKVMKMYDFGITLNGFYVHDPDILEAVPLPEGLDPKVLAQLIIERSGSLYPFIQADTYLKRQIHTWFQTNYHNFERILLAINADYSPIENYDRTEERLINRATRDNERSSSNHSGQTSESDTLSATNSATTTSSTSGENITLRAADNSETFKNVSKDTSSASSSASDTATNSSTNNKTGSNTDVDSMTRAGSGSEDVTETLHAHGNIGTTRNSEMVLDEIELRKYNIYEDIAARFEDKFMIAVY